MKNLLKDLTPRLFLVGFAIALFSAAAAAQTFVGSVDGGSVARGGSSRGTILMSLPEGLHVNSNRPSGKYLIPTTATVTAAGASISRLIFPRGRDKIFAFSDVPLNVYDGTVEFRFTLRVPRGFRGNVVRVRALVRYQPCTTEVCYPPKTSDFVFTARVLP